MVIKDTLENQNINKVLVSEDKYKYGGCWETGTHGRPIKNFFYNKLCYDIFNLIIDINYKSKREEFIIKTKNELPKKIEELCSRKKEFYLKLNKKHKILNPTGDLSVNQLNFQHWHNYYITSILRKETQSIHKF